MFLTVVRLSTFENLGAEETRRPLGRKGLGLVHHVRVRIGTLSRHGFWPGSVANRRPRTKYLVLRPPKTA
jgi:hypothetical protein